MHRITRQNKSSIFLLELIFSILIFIVSAAICVQLCANARVLSNETAKLDTAVTDCSSIAELVYSSDSESALVASLEDNFDKVMVNDKSGAQEVRIINDDITIVCEIESANQMLTAHISAYEEDSPESTKTSSKSSAASSKGSSNDASNGKPADKSSKPIYELNAKHFTGAKA